MISKVGVCNSLIVKRSSKKYGAALNVRLNKEEMSFLSKLLSSEVFNLYGIAKYVDNSRIKNKLKSAESLRKKFDKAAEVCH